MAAHRYWRIYITSNTSGGPHLDCSEIEMRTSVGGADQCTGGTASASSEVGGFEASKAFDNSTGTTWYTPSSNLPAWVKYDFGSGNDKDIVEVALTCWSPNEHPRDWSLQYSDDNSTWTTLFAATSLTAWSANETRAFSFQNPVSAYRYWGLSISAMDGGSAVTIADLELRTSAGGVDQTGSGTASASNSAFGHGASGAFDGTSATDWSISGTGNWLAYDFGAGVTKAIVEIAIAADANPVNSPKDFKLMLSPDGLAWYPVWTITGITGWTSGQRRTFNSSGETTTPTVPNAARFWRIVSIANNGGSNSAIAEIELKTTAGGSDQTGSGTAYSGTAIVTGNDADKAFDNNSTTKWQSTVTAYAWLAYDFGSGVTKQIVQYSITAPNASTTETPKDFLFQRSQDGLGWVTHDTVTNQTGWSAAETRLYLSSVLPPANARPQVCVCT
jgi:hypothetical protein